MKTAVLSALAVAALAGSAVAQSSVTLRWREVSNQSVVPAGAIPATTPTNSTANDATIWLVLEARVDAAAGSGIRGLGGFAGDIQVSDARGTGGSFKVTGSGRISSPATSASAPGFSFPTAGGTNRGIFAPFRLVADLGEVATGVINAAAIPSNSISQIVGATGGSAIGALVDGDATEANFGLGVFVPIYTFQYDVTSLAARTVTVTANLQASAFSTFDANNVPNSIAVPSNSAQFIFTVVPAPGAMALLGLGGLVATRRRRA